MLNVQDSHGLPLCRAAAKAVRIERRCLGGYLPRRTAGAAGDAAPPRARPAFDVGGSLQPTSRINVNGDRDMASNATTHGFLCWCIYCAAPAAYRFAAGGFVRTFNLLLPPVLLSGSV